jgi:hypothetical protein
MNFIFFHFETPLQAVLLLLRSDSGKEALRGSEALRRFCPIHEVQVRK